jgi:NAD kinase
MASFDKIVIITRKTPLDELIHKFNTKSQAKFYIEATGGDFSWYERVSSKYEQSLDKLKNTLPQSIKKQFIDRDFLPNFLFGERDLIITLGVDGLVVNTAKYLNGQPILAVNPDPSTIDGVLLPFSVEQVSERLSRVLDNDYRTKDITMAKAVLNDGQSIYGFNDLFIGQKSHTSARYSIQYASQMEHHISSGIIITTGAGSTGWFKSIINASMKISKQYTDPSDSKEGIMDTGFDWSSDYLYFSVREPFPSRSSQAGIVFGKITSMDMLKVESEMPENGVIFSDGIEADFINFNSGSIAEIGLADKHTMLIVR